MAYICILNIYIKEALIDLSNSSQYNKSIKHRAPFPTFISGCSFTFLTGQTVEQTHMTCASTLAVYSGKQSIKKQNGNTQY